ncbi:MAG: septum formation initiator family protein [Gemmiger sp.]|nr:septum formation initiator family protein [Gemmiger sp.]
MKKHGILPAWLMPLALLALCAYLVLNLVRTQVTISTKRQELAAVKADLSTQLAKNEELSRSLADGEDAIIERIAREQGYAKPNERIFVDYSGK